MEYWPVSWSTGQCHGVLASVMEYWPASWSTGQECEQVLPCDQAGWPAVHQDHRRPRLLERLDRAAHLLAGADHGQRRRHMAADRVLRARPAGDKRVEEVALHHGADHLGGHDRGLLFHHR